MFQSYQIANFAGKPDNAEPYVKKIMEIDPLTPVSYIVSGYFHWMEGEFDLSIAAFRKASQMRPERSFMKYFTCRFLAMDGQLDKAFELIDQTVREGSKELFDILLLFTKYSLQGEKAKALQVLTEEVKKFAWNDPDLPQFMAGYYALIHEKEEALKWLERAVSRGFINDPFLNEKDPFLVSLRSEPRFQNLMERMKYEWEHFEE